MRWEINPFMLSFQIFQVLLPYFQKESIIHESSCINTPQQK